MAVLLVQTLMNLVQTWIISCVGTEAIAAVSVVLPWTVLMITMSSAGVGSVASSIARAFGSGEQERAPLRHLPELLVLGTTNMLIWHSCIVLAVRELSSGCAAVPGYTMPVFSAVMGAGAIRQSHWPAPGIGRDFGRSGCWQMNSSNCRVGRRAGTSRSSPQQVGR
jgi:drug/metabolite transporter (DMT)-like permease